MPPRRPWSRRSTRSVPEHAPRAPRSRWPRRARSATISGVTAVRTGCLAVALLLASCGGDEERAILFDVDTVSGCWNPATRIRALQVRVADATSYPKSSLLPTVAGFDECLAADTNLTRNGISTPFLNRGYIASDLPADRSIVLAVMAYSVPPCPRPEQRAFLLCLFSEPFTPAQTSHVKLHAACGPLSPCGNIR